MTPKERFFATLEGKQTDRPLNLNILMLFAAKHTNVPYSVFCTDYRKLVEANYLCCEKFSIDLLSTMSDPFRETADFGTKLEFPTNDLPRCESVLLKSIEDVNNLKMFKPLKSVRILDRINAIKQYKEKYGNEYPILGWIEGPLAEACDLRGINDAMVDLIEEDLFDELLEVCTKQGLACAKAQIEEGADIIGIGDAAASIIGPTLYEEKIFKYEKNLINGIKKMGGRVKLHICGNISPLLSKIAELKPDILDIDYMVDMNSAVSMFEGIAIVNGNINPINILKGTPESVYEEVKALKALYGSKCSISAGCEIPRDTPHENLLAFARALEN